MVASVLVVAAALALAGLIAQAMQREAAASERAVVPIPVETNDQPRRRR